MKESKLERVNIICDSPTQEYQVHKSIIGEDLTWVPSDKLEVINSDEEGIIVKLNIKKNSEKVVVRQLLELRDFLNSQELDFTTFNINSAIGHTGFEFDPSVEIPRILVNMSEAEILNYHINIKDEERENWKKLYIEVLKYVIYKQAICTNYSEYYGDNVYEYFPVIYRQEDFSSFDKMKNKVMIDLLDNRVLIDCIESIQVFKSFRRDYAMNSYAIYNGRFDDLDNLDTLITSDTVISVKQRYSENGSVEGANYKINNYDVEASKNVPKNLLYMVCVADEQPISNTTDYTLEKIRLMDKYDLMINLVKPLEEEVIVKGTSVNYEMIKKIKVIGIVEKPELKKPEIKWSETEPESIPMDVEGQEVDYIDNTLNMRNLIITIEPYQKQIMEYDELKKKIEFMSLYDFVTTNEFKMMSQDITEEEIKEYLANVKYKLTEDSNIDLSGQGDTAVAIIRDWQEMLPQVITMCIDRSIKVKKMLEKNSAVLSVEVGRNSDGVMSAEDQIEFEDKINEINRIVADSIRTININTLQYLEDTLLYDLTKLSLSSPEDTLVFKYIKKVILNSDDIWDSISYLFDKTEVLSDNKKYLINLIREICSSTLINSMKLNNDIFKELLNNYVNGSSDFVETCSAMNRYIILICLSAVEE